MTSVHSPEILIRTASVTDAPALLAIYAPFVTATAITFETSVPTVQAFARRITQTLLRYPYILAAEGDKVLGYAYAGPFNARAAYAWAAETTIYLDGAAQGRGLGRRLYAALETLLLRQGILNLNACISLPPASDPYLTCQSAEFHEHLGYRQVAHFHKCGCKFNRWYDMIWMEKLLGPHPLPPPAFCPFPDLDPALRSQVLS
ncbi:MAG: GNAT family N-acetyltransferase [Oscillospiraceae bacterium]|nr:GNAT family N-acetyltransferase [Oscillospiraceae bacterium]